MATVDLSPWTPCRYQNGLGLTRSVFPDGRDLLAYFRLLAPYHQAGLRRCSRATPPDTTSRARLIQRCPAPPSATCCVVVATQVSPLSWTPEDHCSPLAQGDASDAAICQRFDHDKLQSLSQKSLFLGAECHRPLGDEINEGGGSRLAVLLRRPSDNRWR